MPITKLINFEEEYQKLHTTPIIANTIDVSTEEGKEVFNSLLLSVYEGDSLKPAPQCSCVIEPLRGKFRVGEVCSKCGDPVEEVFDTDIVSNIWLVPLPDTGAFITPLAWDFLQKSMRLDSTDCLRYLVDPYYSIKGRKVPPRLKVIIDELIPKYGRGLKSFYENFDEFMEYFIHKSNKSNSKQNIKRLLDLDAFIKHNRDRIFTRFLPVPNRVMFPVEKNGNTQYANANISLIVDAVRVIQEGQSRSESLSHNALESRMIKCIELFSKYHYENIKKPIGSKNGFIRQHIFGGRWHFSSRAVIVSIYEPHDFRELHLPWAVAMEQYHVQLVNKLLKRGLDPQSAYDLLKKHSITYSPTIDEIFKELIDESPYLGLPIVLQRNPTLRRPSAILVYVTKVKTDCTDHTISISTGNLTGMNADVSFHRYSISNKHVLLYRNV